MTELARVEVEQRDGTTVARVSGELDVSNAIAKGRELEAAVDSASAGLVIDLTGVGFLDSSAIGVLFGLARKLGARRQKLAVVMPESSPVRRALEIVQFERAAPLCGTLDEALFHDRGDVGGSVA
ncbi:MAG TPA: STAS domain-containing protein [Thermoleophilaceae bacterium]|nr:STAS domain-containing protein [Thermoleophilaceae bacterium]